MKIQLMWKDPDFFDSYAVNYDLKQKGLQPLTDKQIEDIGSKLHSLGLSEYLYVELDLDTMETKILKG